MNLFVLDFEHYILLKRWHALVKPNVLLQFTSLDPVAYFSEDN